MLQDINVNKVSGHTNIAYFDYKNTFLWDVNVLQIWDSENQLLDVASVPEDAENVILTICSQINITPDLVMYKDKAHGWGAVFVSNENMRFAPIKEVIGYEAQDAEVAALAVLLFVVSGSA